MASPTMKKLSNRPMRSLPLHIYRLPIVTRRCAAWVVEVSLVAASALVPYSIGLYANTHSAAAPVPLNPVVATTQEAIAKTLALPWRRASSKQVAPLTNLFWCGAILAPVLVAGWQLYLLGKTGQTTSKRWFGVLVVTASGAPPGLRRVFIREAVGLWGLPMAVAYVIWRFTGAFPELGILVGLYGLTLLGESASFLFSPDRRTLHDRLAGTFVLNAARTGVPYTEPYEKVRPLWHGQQVKLQVSSSWTDAGEATDASEKRHEKVTTIILTSKTGSRWRLWDWMRQHPGVTLLIVAFAGMASVLGTFVGTQVYIQSQANRREFKQQDNQMYLALVKQLSSSNTNNPEERRAAIVALATLDDPRAVPFLVDLLSQEKTVELIDTIQQSLVSTGSVALPHLQRLNQSLTKDLQALRSERTSQEQQLIALRRRASQQAIAKILTIYSAQIHDADLSRVDLSSVTNGFAPFNLVLDKADLSGINFKAAVLANASLRNTRFYGSGGDGSFDTFDDWIADLSGADLKQANLTGALLNHVLMNRTNLIRATLNRSNLSDAHLAGANLSSAQLIGADLHQAVLENATLTGADLADANLTKTNLQGARIGQANAVGAQLPSAFLSKSDWQGADLSVANLSQANLQDANFSSAKMVGANLRNAQLQNANLRDADLSQADLRGANLAGVDFQGTAFTASQPANPDEFIKTAPDEESAARVKGVDFAEARNLDSKQIAFICSQGGRHPKCR
jgi:uncharacterized protein YjbI with pentapeptide repeats/uncharacterized RDD family membrane protein YckC